MGFIEILDTEDNLHLIRPGEIAMISDIGEYRIIYLKNNELNGVVSDLTLLNIKARIKYVQRQWHKVNLIGGMLNSFDND